MLLKRLSLCFFLIGFLNAAAKLGADKIPDFIQENELEGNAAVFRVLCSGSHILEDRYEKVLGYIDIATATSLQAFPNWAGTVSTYTILRGSLSTLSLIEIFWDSQAQEGKREKKFSLIKTGTYFALPFLLNAGIPNECDSTCTMKTLTPTILLLCQGTCAIGGSWIEKLHKTKGINAITAGLTLFIDPSAIEYAFQCASICTGLSIIEALCRRVYNYDKSRDGRAHNQFVQSLLYSSIIWCIMSKNEDAECSPSNSAYMLFGAALLGVAGCMELFVKDDI